MNSDTEDILLRDILLDAAAREFAEDLSSREQIAVSSQFRRQMQNMTANPTKWAKRQSRPLWKRGMRMVAAVLVACFLTLGGVIVISPTARAAIIELVTEWYENSIIYRFFGEPTFENMPKYKITVLPDGYHDTEEQLVLPNSVEITYENEDGDIIRFEYMRIEEGSAIVMDTEDMEISEIEVDGYPGHLYMALDPEQSNSITWYDTQSGIQFVIDGFLDSVDLMRSAGSVVLEK